MCDGSDAMMSMVWRSSFTATEKRPSRASVVADVRRFSNSLGSVAVSLAVRKNGSFLLGLGFGAASFGLGKNSQTVFSNVSIPVSGDVVPTRTGMIDFAKVS